MIKQKNKDENQVTYILDSYEKGLVSQIPARQVSSDALKAAKNVYYNDAYQLATLGGWGVQTTDELFVDKYILASFEDIDIYVGRVDNNTARIYYDSDDVTNYTDVDPTGGSSGDVENWGTVIWSAEATPYYHLYVYYHDGTNFQMWKILHTGITLVSGANAFVFTNDEITQADPAVITETAHGMTNGMRVQLTTAGTLPTGFSLATDYYVVAKAANTFQLSATKAGAGIECTGKTGGGSVQHTVTRVDSIDIGTGVTTMRVVWAFADRLYTAVGLSMYWSELAVPDDWTKGTTTTGSGDAPILGQKGSAIMGAVEFYDNLVVFLDESTIRFIGRNPNSWSLSVISKSVGISWRKAFVRVGTDIFFGNTEGVSYLTAIENYGVIAIDILSLNVTDELLADILEPSTSLSDIDVSIVYCKRYKCLVVSRKQDSRLAVFYLLKALRKKDGGQWTIGTVQAGSDTDEGDNYAVSVDTNWYSSVFIRGKDMYISSAKKVTTVYSVIDTGKQSASVGALSRTAMVVNLPEEATFRKIFIRMMRQTDSGAFWRSAIFRTALWRSDGLTAEVDWRATGDINANTGTFTLTENKMVRASIGLNSRYLEVELSYKNVLGGWIYGALQIVAKFLRSIPHTEV